MRISQTLHTTVAALQLITILGHILEPILAHHSKPLSIP